jgi:hypothetical protein
LVHPAFIGAGSAFFGINWLIPLIVILAFMCCAQRRHLKEYKWTCCGYLTKCQTVWVFISPLTVLIWILLEECCTEDLDDEDEEIKEKSKTAGQVVPFEHRAIKTNLPNLNVDKAGKIKTAQRKGEGKKDLGFAARGEDEVGLPNYKYVPGGNHMTPDGHGQGSELGIESAFGMESNTLQSGVMSEMGIFQARSGIKRQTTQESLETSESGKKSKKEKKDIRKKKFRDRAYSEITKADVKIEGTLPAEDGDEPEINADIQ